MGWRAVGEYGPYLALAVAGGFKEDVAAVRRRAGALVLATVAGDLDDLARGGFHDVDVEIAVRPPPTEGHHLAVGGPGRIDEVALVGQIEFGGVGAVGVHHVELGVASAVADKNDALAGLRIPGRGGAGGGGVGGALVGAAVSVGVEERGSG